jgi:hypothetical protein
MVPVSNGESISTPPRVAAQGPAAIHFKFLLYPHDVHRTRPLIRISRQLSTGFYTRNQQVAALTADVMRRSGDQDGLARQPPGSSLRRRDRDGRRQSAPVGAQTSENASGFIQKYLPKGTEISTSLEYHRTVDDSLNLLDPCYISD